MVISQVLYNIFLYVLLINAIFIDINSMLCTNTTPLSAGEVYLAIKLMVILIIYPSSSGWKLSILSVGVRQRR